MELKNENLVTVKELGHRNQLLQATWIAYRELVWGSLGEARELLRVGVLRECGDNEYVVPGSMSDFTWKIYGDALVANDDFGAEVVIKDGLVSVRTCGGHWLKVKVLGYDNVEITADPRPSTEAWGDVDLGLEGEDLARARAARITKALEW